MKLFLDTGVLIAAISPADKHHAAARNVFHRIAEHEWKEVYTSDYVLAEALNFVRFKIRRREAVDAALEPVFGRRDAPAAVTGILRIHSGRFADALERFRTYFDRGLSFTDCTTLTVMDQEDIEELATFDSGFKGLAKLVS